MKQLSGAWAKNGSLWLSRAFLWVFAVLLLGLDCACRPLGAWFFLQFHGWTGPYVLYTMLTVYTGSIPAWLTLYYLRKLLVNLAHGEVFARENVRCMRIVSWCCVAAAGIALCSMAYYIPFVFIAMAAGFMALIVRIVKNAFAEAIEMKAELDLTI